MPWIAVRCLETAPTNSQSHGMSVVTLQIDVELI